VTTAPLLARYRRIAPVYDLLDLPFELGRYRSARRMLMAGLAGHILDAGAGTGRNMEHYPADARVTAVDLSPAMLTRARRRRDRLGLPPERVRLIEADIGATGLPAGSFDAAVATFLFCVLPGPAQSPALAEIARLLRPGAELRLLDLARPTGGPWRRLSARLWAPWMRWAYGARYDSGVELRLAAAGFEPIEDRLLHRGPVRLLTARLTAG
jgi:ubiquinone/menaquinone biosynthesis C-methylase UbiE